MHACNIPYILLTVWTRIELRKGNQGKCQSWWSMSAAIFFLWRLHFRAVVVSQQNWAEGAHGSHVLPALTQGQLPYYYNSHHHTIDETHTDPSVSFQSRVYAGFTLAVVCSMGFSNVSFVHRDSITQSRFTTVKGLCAPPGHPSLHTDLFIVSLVLWFPEWYTGGLIQWQPFRIGFSHLVLCTWVPSICFHVSCQVRSLLKAVTSCH